MCLKTDINQILYKSLILSPNMDCPVDWGIEYTDCTSAEG